MKTVKRKWERFWKSSRRNGLLVFKTGLFNDSDNSVPLLGFHAEDVLQEAVADSDFDIYELMKLAVSIYRARVTDSNGDWDEDIAIGMGGVGERGQLTIDSP